MTRRIASHYALINGLLERDIVVEVATDGIITEVRRESALDSCAGVEFYPGILIPGMINAHCHTELSYMRGAIPEGGGYATFAREIGRLRGTFSDEERRRAAHVADATMWHEGVEAVADIANDELIMDIKEASNIEYHTLFEFFGLTNNRMAEMRAMAQRHAHSRLTPHSTYSVQDEPFRSICLDTEQTLSVHFLESDDEAALYRGEGSLNAWYQRMGWECDFLHYGAPAERIVGSIPKEAHIMLVHATRATEHDIEVIDSYLGNNATWVLCPESNRYISGLKPPVEALRQRGVEIAIGTDSLASARHLSMVENMRLIENVPLNEVLCYATINGAKALGIEQTKGSIECGKRPGLVVISGVDFEHMCLTKESKSRRIL